MKKRAEVVTLSDRQKYLEALKRFLSVKENVDDLIDGIKRTDEVEKTEVALRVKKNNTPEV